MDQNYRAAEQQWRDVEFGRDHGVLGCSCILELLARIEALETDRIEHAQCIQLCIDGLVSRIEALEKDGVAIKLNNGVTIRGSAILRTSSEPEQQPFGCKPRWLVDVKRLEDLHAAMKRYEINGRQVPPEWKQEAREIIERQRTPDEPTQPAPADGVVERLPDELPNGSWRPGWPAPADGLVKRVADVIYRSDSFRDEARAAIREVAAWLRSELISRAAADRLDQEADQ